MWKCRNCGLDIMFSAAPPEIDQDGIFFLCVSCRHRNVLINVGGEDDTIALAQPEE